jgi:hypothetical protein
MPNLIKIRVKSNKNIVKKSQENLRLNSPKIARSRMKAAAQDLKRRMSAPGKQIKYPVAWDSDKQRIKVIIMLKRRKNIPYKRSQKTEQGWKVISIPTGYTLENRVRGNVFVYGDKDGAHQSAIHRGRWPNLRRQADIVIKALPASVKKALVAYVSKVAGEANSKKGVS